MAVENLGPAVISIAWVFGALSVGVVGARFYVRLRILNKLTVDDYVIVIALILGLLNNVFLSVATSWGLGQHIKALQSEPIHIMYTIKYVYLCEAFAILSPGFGRISYGFLLLSLLPPTKRRRRFLWAILGIQFVVDVGGVTISFIQCRPINGFWDKRIDADCWPPYYQEYTGYVQGSVGSAVDLILALFPASLFWNLHMEWRQKASLSVLMGLGIFGMVASIVKTIELRAITQTEDLTYAMAVLGIWWTLEAYLVLIAVSVPTLRPIMKRAKGPTERSDASWNGVNIYASKNKSGFAKHSETYGQFKRLHDTVILADITGEGRPSRVGHIGMETRAHVGDEESQHYDGNGIRRNIDVSVTYDKPF
ncbi:integral membrane protein [Xylaria cubensis]|nr:integral membrane protein [Xylaria cubensis]